jgi:hypothetical protein
VTLHSSLLCPNLAFVSFLLSKPRFPNMSKVATITQEPGPLKRQWSLGVEREGCSSPGFSPQDDAIVFDPNRQRLVKQSKNAIMGKLNRNCDRLASS